MTATTVPKLGRPPRSRRVLTTLTWLEARRLLAFPALPVGLGFSVLFGLDAADQDWSGAAYGVLPAALGPLLFAISLATATAFSRDRVPLAPDVPVQAGQRAVARLLAAVPVVAVVAVLTLAGAVWLRLSGGLDLGDEPGRTLHAHYTLPELLQPVALAAFAAALGAALTRLIRSRAAAAIALFIFWLAVSPTYWLFNGPALTAFSVIQTQPLTVPVGPVTADPTSFPASWLLAAPGQYQDFWGRVVVSPSMAAWHDLYLVGLTLLLAAIALHGRPRRATGAVGVVLAVLGVVAQKLVQP
jgi:hypothetical protein